MKVPLILVFTSWLNFADFRLLIGCVISFYSLCLLYRSHTDLKKNWSPNGTELVFWSDRSGQFHVWEHSLSTGIETQITSQTGSHKHPCYSPDGLMIAFDLNNSGCEDIWTINLDSGDLQQVTTNSSRDECPSWNNTGSEIVFNSIRTSNFDIWIIPVSGGMPVQVTFDLADDKFPCWSPNSDQIAFSSDRFGNHDMWIIDVESISSSTILSRKMVELSNFPNPFNLSTTISFNFTIEITKDTVIVIYNLKGQKVKIFDSFSKGSLGSRSVVWDGRDEHGNSVSSGIYFYTLKTARREKTKKMILKK